MVVEAVTDPAPPPCEECEWYLTHTDGGQHAKALHAEIAELRALFGRAQSVLTDQPKLITLCDCAGCVWFARARAALALMDEADWHVEAPKEGT